MKSTIFLNEGAVLQLKLLETVSRSGSNQEGLLVPLFMSSGL